MGSPCGAHAELARGATRGPFGRYTWDPYGPHHGPIWAPHGQSIRATCGPHEGGPTGQLWAAHAGPTQNWPRGLQWAHSGDTRGTHLGPTMDPSGLHTGSPYGPQMGPMRVAQRALYGRSTWDPDRIGQGATRGPYGRDTWDPSGPQQGPICTPNGQSIGPRVGGPKGSLWAAHMGPRQNWPVSTQTAKRPISASRHLMSCMGPVLRHAANPCWSRSLLKMVALELQ